MPGPGSMELRGHELVAFDFAPVGFAGFDQQRQLILVERQGFAVFKQTSVEASQLLPQGSVSNL